MNRQDRTLSQTDAVYLKSKFLMDPRSHAYRKETNSPPFSEAVKLHVTLQSALRRYDQNNPQLFIPNELKWGLCLLIFSAMLLSLAEHRGCCCFRALEGWLKQASELWWVVRRQVKAANSYFFCRCCAHLHCRETGAQRLSAAQNIFSLAYCSRANEQHTGWHLAVRADGVTCRCDVVFICESIISESELVYPE